MPCESVEGDPDENSGAKPVFTGEFGALLPFFQDFSGLELIEVLIPLNQIIIEIELAEEIMSC